MATVKDKNKVDIFLSDDRQAFVFNWLSTPFQKRRDGDNPDLSARIEDILDELQTNKDCSATKIRMK